MTWRETQVDPGATVEAADGPLGTVEEVFVSPVSGEMTHLLVRRGGSTERVTVPASAIAEVPSRFTVRLGVSRDQLGGIASGVRSESRSGAQIRVPVLEERIAIEARPIDLGEVRLHKTVETFEGVAHQDILEEDVVIERIPMNRQLDAPAESRMEGEWLVVPIMEEVLVVQKRLMLTEEVRIKKRQVTKQYEVREPLRREHVEIDDATVRGIEVRSGVPPT